MKKNFLALCLILLTGTSARSAQIGLYNAFWSPADFNADYGPGIKLQADLNEIYHLEFRTTLFPNMGEDFDTESGKVEVELQTIPMEFGFLMDFPYVDDPFIQSYVGGGFGYYLIDLSAKGPAGTIDYESDDEIGFYALVGARMYVATEIVLFGDLMYRFVEGKAVTKHEDGSKSTIDMNLNGPGVNIGIALIW